LGERRFGCGGCCCELVEEPVAALIAGHRDDRADAATQLRAAEELPGLAEDRGIYGVDLLRAQAMAAEQDERPGDARDYLAEAELGEAGELHWRADLVRCAMAAGDRPAAEAAVARCGEGAAGREGGAVRPCGSSAVAARWCRGLPDADPVPLAEAVAYYRAVTRPLELGQALEDPAVALAARADEAAARPALREAVEHYASLGAEWDILRADTRVLPYGMRWRRSRTRRPETGWAALTPTEAKVAYLVEEGLPNPEIGKRLFLSRYTVQVHVSKILAKLQVRSRVGVAGEVGRQPAESRPPAARSTA
jgi:DNA-binding NarL/FixJ family response regulator